MKYLVPVFVACLPLVAQQAPIGPRDVYPQLQRYLELTPNQVASLTATENDFNRYLAAKMVRVSVIQRELDELRRAEGLDPFAYGSRYVEMEAICREAKDRQNQARDRARATLNDVQRQRMQTLDQAFALAPVIWEAQNLQLMRRTVPYQFNAGGIGPGNMPAMVNQNLVLNLGTEPVLPGCAVPQPQGIQNPFPPTLAPGNPNPAP